jgi:general secretion pathway protein M
MRPLKPMESRLLAVGLLVAIAAGAAYALADAKRRGHAHFDELIAQRLDQVARYNRVAATRADYEKNIAAVAAREADRFYLKASAPALAAADIQQVVQTVVEANGLRSESMQIAPHKDEDGRRQITVNLRLRGKLQGVQNMLYALETTQPYLFIDNLNIQSTVRFNFVPTPGVEPEVMAQFDLSGYALLKKTDAPSRR